MIFIARLRDIPFIRLSGNHYASTADLLVFSHMEGGMHVHRRVARIGIGCYRDGGVGPRCDVATRARCCTV